MEETHLKQISTDIAIYGEEFEKKVRSIFIVGFINFVYEGHT